METLDFVCTNSSLHKGGRIWLLWDPYSYDVTVVDIQVQCIHTKVVDKVRRKEFWFTVVYGLNKLADREPLWASLRKYHSGINGPWMIGGDFNAIMDGHERIGGAPVTNAEIRPLYQVVHDCQLADLSAKGSFYTWNNKHECGTKVYSRLDRILINADWLLCFPDSFTHFLPEGVFDHCPGIVNFELPCQRRGQPFKYFNMWSLAPRYKDIVKSGWDKTYHGSPMYCVVKKLKDLKVGLKKLNREQFGDIENLTHVLEIFSGKIQELLFRILLIMSFVRLKGIVQRKWGSLDKLGTNS
ncbi:uncharacterized protein LOC141614240 [Silene latifolia]|uniref:uncharacterized protein LOC141614240 n=1 Tax=Silene latifolia TaxID=37657 RepID=UPI003D770319